MLRRRRTVQLRRRSSRPIPRRPSQQHARVRGDRGRRRSPRDRARPARRSAKATSRTSRRRAAQTVRARPANSSSLQSSHDQAALVRPARRRARPGRPRRGGDRRLPAASRAPAADAPAAKGSTTSPSNGGLRISPRPVYGGALLGSRNVVLSDADRVVGRVTRRSELARVCGSDRGDGVAVGNPARRLAGGQDSSHPAHRPRWNGRRVDGAQRGDAGRGRGQDARSGASARRPTTSVSVARRGSRRPSRIATSSASSTSSTSADGTLGLVMELLRGGTLEACMRERGPLSIDARASPSPPRSCRRCTTCTRRASSIAT